MYERFAKQIFSKLGKEEALPTVAFEEDRFNPLCVKVTLICEERRKVSKFFFEMVSRWVLPGKKVETPFQFSATYKGYSICQMGLQFRSVQDAAMAKRQFPFLRKEILMGAGSVYHQEKILEMKGLSIDEKSSLVRERLARLVAKFPSTFDFDLFENMQHFFYATKEEFKSVHEVKEITRLIATLYHFQKQLRKVEGRRQVLLKMKTIVLQTPFGMKEVLSISVGMNFLREHELFEERHFLSALSHCIPGVRSIPGSYYAYEGKEEEIHTFCIEVEKDSLEAFDSEELLLLEKRLAKEISSRIEQLVPPVFMPRNEEEVMRNVLTLSQQLRYLRDIPQMHISFDEQEGAMLLFTVCLVRILLPESPPIQELFSGEQFSIDRIKLVGRIRRKYSKEAAVLRVRLSSEPFLRGDFSVDLYAARLDLVEQIEGILGEVRDYNGGMIAKQSENYSRLKALLGPLAKKHPLLLQNFFHSIFPVQLSTTLDPMLLEILFQMLIEAMENPKESVALKSKKASDHLFVMTKFQDFSWKQKMFAQVQQLAIPSNELLTIEMQIFDSFYLGFVYLNPERDNQQQLLDSLPLALVCSC